MIVLMTNTTAEKAQKDTGKRHGYAIYTADGYVAFSVSMFSANEHPGAVRVVNVQNGAYFELKDGEVINTVFADEVPAS